MQSTITKAIMNLPLAVIALLVAMTMVGTSSVYADGNGSPDECWENQNTNVIGSVGGSASAVSYDVGAGKIVTGVCIKSGAGTFGGVTHSGVITTDGAYDNGCYIVSGIATQEVTVTRPNASRTCKDISHIDVVFAETTTPLPDLNWDVVCDVNTLEAVVEVSNMGNAAGDINVNGETITVNTAETVEKRVYTGEDGIQVTLVLDNQTVYDEFLTCVGGRGGNDGEVGGETTTAPTSTSQKPTEAKLPKTAGDGSVAAITVGSIVALVGTAVGVARRFASNL